MAGYDELELVLSVEKRAVELAFLEIQPHGQEIADTQAALAAETNLDLVFRAADTQQEGQLLAAVRIVHQLRQRALERGVDNGRIVEQGCRVQR